MVASERQRYSRAIECYEQQILNDHTSHEQTGQAPSTMRVHWSRGADGKKKRKEKKIGDGHRSGVFLCSAVLAFAGGDTEGGGWASSIGE